MGREPESSPAGFGILCRFPFCRPIIIFKMLVRVIRGVRHRPGRVSDCSGNGAANTNHPSPFFPFALSLVEELLKSIVAADGGLMHLSAGDSACFQCSGLRPGSAFCCGLAFIRSAQYAQESEAVLLRPRRMPGPSRLPHWTIVGPLAIIS